LYNTIYYQETVDGKNILPFILTANFNSNEKITLYFELFLHNNVNIKITNITILNKDNSNKFYKYVDNMLSKINQNKSRKITSIMKNTIIKQNNENIKQTYDTDDIFIKNIESSENNDTESMIPTVNSISSYESESNIETTIDD
jgi:hypothetical protein